MPVNKQELAADLATPEYQEVVKQALANQKVLVITEAERTSLLDNHKKEVIDKELPNEIKKVHDQYDNDLNSLFPNLKRDIGNNEKTYDFMKRAVTTSLKQKEDEINKLNDLIKKGDPTGAAAKRIQEIEDAAKQQIELRDKQIDELKTGNTNAIKAVKFNDAFAGIRSKFVKQLPPMFAQTEAAINREVLIKAVLKDNVLYAGNPDGSIKKNPSTFKEITVEEELTELYKDVTDSRKKQGGSGSGQHHDDLKTKIDPKTVKADTFDVPAEIMAEKNTTKLMDYMIEVGIARGTKLFTEIWAKYVDPNTGKMRE